MVFVFFLLSLLSGSVFAEHRKEKTELCFIGAGYVGGTTGAVFADKCADVNVTIADLNKQRIAQWNSKRLPLYEEGLEEIVKRNINKTLFFTTDIEDAIKKADIVFLCVNTPTKTTGIDAGSAHNMQYFNAAVETFVKNAKDNVILVEKSTVPCGTAEKIQSLVKKIQRKGMDVRYSPIPSFWHREQQ